MDIETALFLLKICGGLIGIMLAALGFFITSIIVTVNKVNNTAIRFQQWLDDHTKNHEVIGEVINDHSNDINQAKTDIAVLKSKMKIA